MKKIILSLLILFGFTNMVTADETAVYDEANLLQENQIVELENKISSIENEYGIDIVLLTINDAQGKSAQVYAEDYLDALYYDGVVSDDSMILLLDMDNREIYASYTGEAIRYFTDNRQDDILDVIYDYVADGNYYEMFNQYLSEVDYYLEAGIPSGQYTVYEKNFSEKMMTIATYSIFALILALIIGFITMKTATKKGRHYSKEVLAKNRAPLTVNYFRDEKVLVDTKETRTIINTGSGGRSSGGSRSSGSRSSSHRSSSGRSHSGGGRRF